MHQAQNEIRTQPRPKCFLCGTEGKPLYRDRIDALFDAPGTWNLDKCPQAACGLIWLNPAPLEEDLHLAYQTYFTHGASDGKPSASAQLRVFLYGVYKLAHRLPAVVLGLRKPKAQIQTMYLGDLNPGKVLDVGCGDGAFLNRMRNLGWSVYGVDFDAKAIETAKVKYTLNLRHGDLRSAKFPDNTFEAVTLSHVIEHVPDPVALLEEVRRILRPGGRMVLTTPNSGSFGHEKFQAHWFGIDPPRHLHVFSLNTLGACAQRAKLEVVQTTSTAANADIFIGGSYSIREVGNHRGSNLPRPNINILRGMKGAFFQYRELFSLRTNPECGEEAVLTCEKK